MNFTNGDKVQIHSTSDDELDLLSGTIIGEFGKDESYGSYYIVFLNSRHSKIPWDAIAITQHCLKSI